MTVIANDFPNGVPMPLGGVATVATLLLVALQPDTLCTRSQALHRLREAGCTDPETYLEAALKAEWLHVEANGNIGYTSCSWLPVSKKVATSATVGSPASFSYFKGPITNVIPTRDITVGELYWLIKSDTLVELTQQLRSAPEKSEVREQLKKRLPYVTPAGTFAKRANTQLIARSGLIVLDFDHVSDVVSTRARLLADPHLPIELLYISPSGNGIKAFVKVPLEHEHQDNFAALTACVQRHGLTPDPCGKDWARACFVCHDPGVWIHPSHLQKASR